MRIALAGLDPSDPTDRAVALGLGGALRRRGHRVFFPKLGASREFLKRFHHERRVELWHLHLFGRKPGPVGDFLRKHPRPFLLTPHLVLSDYARFAGEPAALRRLFAAAGAVAAVCESSRRELSTLFPECRRGLSTVYAYGPRRGAAPLSGPSRSLAFCAARLAPYKGIDILLLAFAAVTESFPGLDLVVCGRDKSRGGHARLARRLGLGHRVRFTGELSPSRLGRLRRAASFVVVPSRRDNFPIAALEAMADGKAIVASRVGGIPEMIRAERDGILAAPGDPKSLSRAMMRLAADASLRRRLGKSAQARAREFSWERAASDYEKIYAELLE